MGPENVILEESLLEAYSLDAFGRYRGMEQQGSLPPRVHAAVRPSSTSKVAEVVKLAHRERIPLVPYGGGTGIAGAVTPLQGGIAVDLKKMNRIVALNSEDRAATVEAGVLLGDLDEALKGEGLMLGHDPYSVPIATLGGAISTNGVGYRAAKYGSMGEQVLGLEVVLPTGEVLQTRAVPKSSAGPSLHHLFIGSEGVFGIITQATIRIFRLPEARVFKTVAFAKFEDGFHALQEMSSLGLRPALVDLTEEPPGPPDGPPEGSSTPSETRMYLVFEGYAEEVEAQLARTLKVCHASRGEDIGPAPTRQYWDTRHDSAYRYKERFIDRSVREWPTEEWPRRTGYPHVAIPASQVLEYRHRCYEIASRQHLWVRECSLWTQPELFSMMLVDVSLEGQGEEGTLAQAVDEMLTLAQDMGGSMEYVHGVGVKLAHLLPRELGTGMDVLRRLKTTLDPHNIMNPGKLAL
ncbi:MAG: FAD-binding PCMH-type protein [Dehalococcoidia bacterium]|nr:FAD-binding PCMH-type protein [Dehalococcoidia bacterium]